MDPMNNPTPTPNPTPAPSPAPGPVPSPTMTATPGAPDSITAGAFEHPAANSGSSVSSPSSIPVGNPASVGGAAPVNPVIQPSGAPVPPPVNPVIRPTGLGVTDPIMMPEKPAEPDPVEEELKAPMKAAAPVPGSIGSAMSGPAAGQIGSPVDNPFVNGAAGQTPSVSFTDPAAQSGPEQNSNTDVKQTKPAMKITNKNTLIALIAVAAVIVVALIVVLIIQLANG